MNLITDRTSWIRTNWVEKRKEGADNFIILENDKKGLLCKLLACFKFFVEVSRIRSEKNYAICITNPHIMYVTLLILVLRINSNKITIFYPEFIMVGRYVYPLYLMIESLSYNANKIFPSKERAQLHQWYYRLSRIIHGVEKNNGHPQDINKKVGVNKLDNTAVYAGVLYPSRPINAELEYLVASGFMVDVYGAGDEKYIDEICKISPSSITYHGPYDSVKEEEIMRKYSIGIISYPSNSLNNYFCAPNKLAVFERNNVKVISLSPNTLTIENGGADECCK